MTTQVPDNIRTCGSCHGYGRLGVTTCRECKGQGKVNYSRANP